jgi:hypothetical protein
MSLKTELRPGVLGDCTKLILHRKLESGVVGLKNLGKFWNFTAWRPKVPKIGK